jgi:hypothetical protein
MGFLKNTLLTAGIATAATTLAAAFLGQREAGSPAAPLNATSHILWGDKAAEQDGFSAEYTLAGAVLNAGAMFGWAALQELIVGRWARQGTPARAVAAGAATSAIAYATDYHVVPKRLTPGFEKRLSSESLAIVYFVLAATMAFGVRKGR